MAINKARSAPWVKATVIIVAIAFVLSVGLPFLTSITRSPSSKSSTTTSTSGPSQVSSIGSKFKGTIASNDQALQSDPKNNGVLVSQGNAYYDWALEAAQATKTDPQAQAELKPLWLAAADYYGQALAVAYEPNVATDRAISLFYSGKTAEAIAQGLQVTKKDPKFDKVWYNLGIFYETSGDNAAALKAYTTYLGLKPTDQNNISTAKSKIQTLRQAKPSVTTTP